jgi:hypothetical protein
MRARKGERENETLGNGEAVSAVTIRIDLRALALRALPMSAGPNYIIDHDTLIFI